MPTYQSSNWRYWVLFGLSIALSLSVFLPWVDITFSSQGSTSSGGLSANALGGVLGIFPLPGQGWGPGIYLLGAGVVLAGLSLTGALTKYPIWAGILIFASYAVALAVLWGFNLIGGGSLTSKLTNASQSTSNTSTSSQFSINTTVSVSWGASLGLILAILIVIFATIELSYSR